MFRGYDELSMDNKGRFALPTRYHERSLAENQGRFVATVDIRENCVVLYPLAEWERIEARFNNLPSSDPRLAMLKRRIIGHATDVAMDSAGRLLISAALRNYANLDKSVVLAGMGMKCELWDKTAWEATQQISVSTDYSAPELAGSIDSLAL